MKKIIKNKQLIAFGRSLKKARIKAGYNSLSEGIEGIRKIDNKITFSRATLNLIENGSILDLNTDFLKILCKAYSLDFNSILKEYLEARFALPKTMFRQETDIIKSVKKDSLTFQKSSENNLAPVEIWNLDKFKKQQAALPKGSIVWVSVINFIDDKTFFELVLTNIKKGVSYYYYIPEESEARYRQFISMLSTELSLPPEQIDNKKSYFVKRGVAEFPISAVLFIYPNKTVEGFVGLSSADDISYFQKADELLSWRLYQSFLMAFSLSLDSEIQLRRKKIDLDLKSINDIKGFPVLMRNLGL